MWNGKNEFVSKAVQTSRVENPLGQAGLATFYTGFYYLKAFTCDAVVGIGTGFTSGAKAIANAQSTEETLLGVGEMYGSVGAMAGMVSGGMGMGQVVSKIGSSTFTIPILNGSEAALATATVPTGALVAGAMPGGIGIVLMSASGRAGGKKPPKSGDLEEIARIKDKVIHTAVRLKELENALEQAIIEGNEATIIKAVRELYFLRTEVKVEILDSVKSSVLDQFAHDPIVRVELSLLKANESIVGKCLKRRLTSADMDTLDLVTKWKGDFGLLANHADPNVKFWASVKQAFIRIEPLSGTVEILRELKGTKN